VTVHRLTSRRFPACDGEGARLYGGRWNSRGRPAVYTAGTQSLAALEILAHAAALGDAYVVVRIEIPDGVLIEGIPVSELSSWATETTRSMGDAWLTRQTSAVLRVPSIVVPVEFNFVLNPAHQDFHRLVIADPEPFRFDPRLLKRFVGSWYG
jgi:RES domain-containing protein